MVHLTFVAFLGNARRVKRIENDTNKKFLDFDKQQRYNFKSHVGSSHFMNSPFARKRLSTTNEFCNLQLTLMKFKHLKNCPPDGKPVVG